MKCPYLKRDGLPCDGIIADGTRDQMVICPKCHRLSARCKKFEHGRLCGALNRVLARHCRQGKHLLDAGWAQQAWMEDAADRIGTAHGAGIAGRSQMLKLGEPETVLDLRDWLRPNPEQLWPIELTEASGRLWVGASDGRFLFAEPFADRAFAAEVLRSNPLWMGRRERLRGRCSGTWMVMYAERGVWWLNLLALDDPHGSRMKPEEIWISPSGGKLVADPIMLRRSAADSPINEHDRILVWLAVEPPDLVFHMAILTLGAQEDIKRARWHLNSDALRGLISADHRERAVLLETSCGAVPACLLVTRHGIWKIDLPNADKSQLHLEPQAQGLELATNRDNIPGVVFVRGSEISNDTTSPGRLFYTDHPGGAGGELRSQTIVAKPTRTVYREYAGLPLDAIELPGQRGALCLSDRTLSLCDGLGRTTTLGSSDDLEGTMHGHVYGWMAVCSGTNLQGTSQRRFAVVMHLEDQRLITSRTWTGLVSHPLLLGSYLFMVEEADDPATGGHGLVSLTRRRLHYESP